MKVLKFGGSSVASAATVAQVRAIIESEDETPIVVVVSALSGVTDQLIEAAQQAAEGLESYNEVMRMVINKHRAMVAELAMSDSIRMCLAEKLEDLYGELVNILKGVYLIKDLSDKTLDTVVSYGERLSSLIVAAAMPGATWIDARTLIKTTRKNGKSIPHAQATEGSIRKAFTQPAPISVLGGFIASDKDSGDTTNLGRGGSDYTAALIASALNARVLEIWTDVDGFMTADPKVIDKTYTINELTYDEATELCNFGAKVIYPPTIYPVWLKKIPIHVKNTFNPTHKGTVISTSLSAVDKQLIKGISSIDNTSIITVHGLGMVGVIGVNYRIFKALAFEGISVFLVSQASSENSTSIGVRSDDTKGACEALNREFAKEIEQGIISPMRALENLSTVAVVGKNMRGNAGVAGRLFQTLGRNGINVITCAQGASELNISLVVERSLLRKALNVIHDSFFLSEYKELNLFLCGIGTVGSSLIEQIESQRQRLMQEQRLKLNVVGIASSSRLLLKREGIDLNRYKEQLQEEGIASNSQVLQEEIIKMNIYNSVFVDCTASEEVAALYYSFLNHNISIVAANKIAASSAYNNYIRLKREALSKGVKFLFETNVGAGLPVINTINDLRNSGDKVVKIEAVLSGTLNYIFSELRADLTLSQAIKQAQEQGYSEPDPRLDLSGTDVMRKLVILAREAGYVLEQSEVEKNLFIPDEFFEGSLSDFWTRIPSLDQEFEEQRSELEKGNKKWCFVAKLEDGKASVGLEVVDKSHPFYLLEGSNNIILLTSDRYKDYPMLIQGYGAGADVTAAGVFADVMSIANV